MHVIAHQDNSVRGPNPVGEELTRHSHGNPADDGELNCWKQSLGRFWPRRLAAAAAAAPLQS